MATPLKPAHAIREYFLLAEAKATSRRLPDARRAAVADTLGVARQRADAADALWTLGHTAEGLRLAVHGFDATLAAASEMARALGLAADEPPTAEGASRDGAAEPGSDTADRETTGEAGQTDELETNAEDVADAETAGGDEATTAKDTAGAETAEGDGATPETSGEEVENGDAEKDGATPTGAVVFSTPTADGPWRKALNARGVPASKLEQIDGLVRSLRRDELPGLDDEVSPAHGELFRDLVQARRNAELVLIPASLTMGQIMRARTARWLGAALVVTLVVTGTYLLLRTPHDTTAVASEVYGNRPDFQPEKVIDDDSDSEWLLPNGQEGWVEVRLSPPRDISTVRLRNAHNRDILDRGTKDYTLELYSAGEVAVTQGGQWSELVPNPQWTEFDVNTPAVERIRVVVRTWHRNGGGIAEIDWDED